MKFQKRMTRLYFIMLIVSLFGVNSFSQAPEVEWSVSFGPTVWPAFTSPIIAADGGYVVAATAWETPLVYGDQDGWVAKLDINGNIEWQDTVNRSGGSADFFTDIKATSDGGYILAGLSDVNSLQDYWVVKISNTGAIEWQRTFGGEYEDEAYSITLADDGGYVVTGSTLSMDGDITDDYYIWDVWVVKLDNAGNLEWQKILGGNDFDAAYSILTDSDGGYVLAGESSSEDGDLTGSSLGGRDAWIVKINHLGEIQWQHRFGGSGNDVFKSVIPAVGGGFIMAGSTGSFELNGSGVYEEDFWVVKIDGSGNLEWEESFGGTLDDYARSITSTSDGGYAVCGYAYSSDVDITEPNPGNLSRGWVIKLDNAGNLAWQKIMLSGQSAFSILETGGGQYIVTTSDGSNNLSAVKLVPVCTACTVPTGLLNLNIGTTTASLTWEDNHCADAYTVRYKIKNAIGGWNSVSVNTNMAEISGLNPATAYLWRVRADCSGDGLGKSAWSVTKKFRTSLPSSLLQLNENEGFSDQPLPSPVPNEPLKIYPNPALNTIHLQVIYPGEYRLLNSAGNLLKQWQLEAGLVEISLENIGPGVYLMQMPDGRVQKFVKL